MSKNIVFEGWLTKSPPSKRIWRTKWRRRWFALRQSGELPGQYFLDYYADRNYRRLKGTINLDLCEQVDAGLHMERTGTGSLDPKLRGSVFTIQTQSRTYHLEADCESDMEKWVDAICQVCGLRATGEEEPCPYLNNTNVNNASVRTNRGYSAVTTGPYIPISECITGVRAQDSQSAFSFDPKNIVTSSRHSHLETFFPSKIPTNMGRVAEQRGHHFHRRHSGIKSTNTHDTDNDSNSEEECKSLTTSQSNIHDYAVAKTFTKLTINPLAEALDKAESAGPPVPPRPPKTFAKTKETLPKETYQGPKIQEPAETGESHTAYGPRVGRRLSQSSTPPSPVRGHVTPNVIASSKLYDDEDEMSSNLQSLQYCNLPSLPPAVDRKLKPRPASHNIAAASTTSRKVSKKSASVTSHYEVRTDTLQYLDLDLAPKSSPTMIQGGRKVSIFHGKSRSAVETDCAYKTVDFLKTEAFNITRQDAEASRKLKRAIARARSLARARARAQARARAEAEARARRSLEQARARKREQANTRTKEQAKAHAKEQAKARALAKVKSRALARARARARAQAQARAIAKAKAHAQINAQLAPKASSSVFNWQTNTQPSNDASKPAPTVAVPPNIHACVAKLMTLNQGADRCVNTNCEACRLKFGDPPRPPRRPSLVTCFTYKCGKHSD